MAVINKLDNAASILYNGETVTSNTVSTALLLPPTVVKAVDKQTASINDTLTYTVTVTNVALGELTNLPFTDVLPEGSSYVEDSFTENGTKATPTLNGSTLSYTIPTIAGGTGISVLQFQVKVEGSPA